MKQNDNFIGVAKVTTSAAMSAVSTAIGLLVGGPLGAMGGAYLSVVLTDGFNEILNRYLNDTESERVAMTFQIAIEKITKNLNEGRTLRNDDFWEKKNGKRTDGNKILEGILLKVRDEYEDKKIKLFANIFANVAFMPHINYDKSNTVLRIAERLSYRQLIILSILHYKSPVINLSRWNSAFIEKSELAFFYDYYYDILNLYDLKLLQQIDVKMGFNLGGGECAISPLGIILKDLMELNNPDNIDLSYKTEIQGTINHINYITQSR